jgi:transcriptional regulator with XRE-family HTH domain
MSMTRAIKLKASNAKTGKSRARKPRTVSPGRLALASYLIAQRTLSGLSQEEAAEQAGVTLKTVQRWELAENEPTMTDLAPYVESLKGSPHKALDYLLGREPQLGEPDEPPGVLAARLKLASLPRAAIEILSPIADRLDQGEPPQ